MFERNSSIEVSHVQVESLDDVKGKAFLSRVFGYMTFWLLLTTLVAIGVGIGFSLYYNQFASGTVEQDRAATVLLVALIISAVGLLITGLVIRIGSISAKFNLQVPAILYSVFMGVLLSTFVMFIQWYILAMAFGITTLAFGGMYLIAKTTKRNLTGLGLAGSGLLMGAFLFILLFAVLGLVNYFSPTPFMTWSLYWLSMGIDAVIFIAIILITMFEMWNIVKIAERGGGTKNLALFCAFSLYTDFVYILIRITLILVRIFGNNRN